ncbi:MAG: hypothetical protein MZV64_02660 [Ignavibacteriales bacterium]|nr:hypothetical protein [Ignavibacteriales bacterium]
MGGFRTDADRRAGDAFARQQHHAADPAGPKEIDSDHAPGGGHPGVYPQAVPLPGGVSGGVGRRPERTGQFLPDSTAGMEVQSPLAGNSVFFLGPGGGRSVARADRKSAGDSPSHAGVIGAGSLFRIRCGLTRGRITGSKRDLTLDTN